MQPIRESVRIYIRRLFFTEHLTFEQIAERLGFSIESVRKAVVIDGGKQPSPRPGPFHKESDS